MILGPWGGLNRHGCSDSVHGSFVTALYTVCWWKLVISLYFTCICHLDQPEVPMKLFGATTIDLSADEEAKGDEDDDSDEALQAFVDS